MELEPWSPIWDVEKASDSLKADVEPYNEVLIGPGYRLRPARANAQLELYPDSHMACFLFPHFRLNLANITSLEPAEDRITVQSQDSETRTTLVFQSTGELTFNVAPRPVEAPKTIPAEAPKTEAKPENKEDKQRVVFTGRVGVEPKVEDTKNGKRLLKLPIAEKDGDKTKWHTVLFFGEKANEMVEKVAKGKLVTVVGYVHEQDKIVKGPTGPIKKKVEVVFGSAISEPKSK